MYFFNNKCETINVHFSFPAWTVGDVYKWIEEKFDKKIAEKFKEEEITGETLVMSDRLLSDTKAMDKLGLHTIGKQEHFKKLVSTLNTKGKIFQQIC